MPVCCALHFPGNMSSSVSVLLKAPFSKLEVKGKHPLFPKGGERENVTALPVFFLCLLYKIFLYLWQGVELKVERLVFWHLRKSPLPSYCLVLSFLVASAETDSKKSSILICCYILNKVLQYKWMRNIVKMSFCFEDQCGSCVKYSESR